MTKDDRSDIPPLLYSARDAARVLGISERTLWALTNQGKMKYGTQKPNAPHKMLELVCEPPKPREGDE